MENTQKCKKKKTLEVLDSRARLSALAFECDYKAPFIISPFQVQDSGLDLNMAEGMAEHVKDAIILAAGSQMLSLLSNYLWLLMLLMPLLAFWMLWVTIISPWLFAPALEDSQIQRSRRWRGRCGRCDEGDGHLQPPPPSPTERHKAARGSHRFTTFAEVQYEISIFVQYC